MRDNVSSLSRGSWLSHGPCYSIQSNPIRKFVIGYMILVILKTKKHEFVLKLTSHFYFLLRSTLQWA